MSNPWIGDAYGRACNSLGGLRLLVLGEAHYDDAQPVGSEIPGMTNHVVQSVIDRRKRYPFFPKVAKLVMGRDLDHAAFCLFWRSVVFANYIPVVAAPAPKQRPTAELWSERAGREFSSLVRDQQVEAILVCGKELWSRMVDAPAISNAFVARGLPRSVRLYPVEGERTALAVYIHHPTGSVGWSPRHWAPALDYLIDSVARDRIEAGREPLADWRHASADGEGPAASLPHIGAVAS